MVGLISKATKQIEAIERRKRLLESSQHPQRGQLLRELEDGVIPTMSFPDGFDIRQHVRQPSRENSRHNGTQVLGEFISTGDFGTEWIERQRYEVYAGRDMEPELWRAIYVETQDSTLPKIIPINRIGPGGAVFEEITEGGEVKFMSVGSSNFSVKLVDYALGIEYSKELVKYNHLWDVAIAERQAGIAHSALQNHIHFFPIMDATYSTSGSKPTETAASAVGDNLLQKYMSTIQKGVQDAKKRLIRGPYVILTGSLNALNAQIAMLLTIQDGNPNRNPVSNQISSVIEYDGWTGTRNAKEVTYAGVADNVGYLIGLGMRADDFRSYSNQALDMMVGEGDVSRRIMQQIIWDLDRGAYADTTAVQKINFPTS